MFTNHLPENNINNLSDADLLSVFLTKDTSKLLLTEYQSLCELILHTSPLELKNLKGIGKARTEKICCIKELLNRLYIAKHNKIHHITNPDDIVNYMRHLENLKQEELHIIMLNTKNRIIGSSMVSKGSVSAAIVSPREVFSPAIKMMATNIIVVHNHPSGDSSPSEDDVRVTNLLVSAGEIVGIHVLDHIIIGKDQYCSMKDKGHII